MSARNPLRALGISALIAALSIVGSLRHLTIETDTYALLPENVPFLTYYNAYKERFSYDRRTNIIVIDGPSPEAAEVAQIALRDRLSQEGPVFNAVRAPGSDGFTRQNAALYMGTDQLENTVDRLAEAAPALEILASDPSLRGLAELFSLAEDAGATDQSDRIAQLLRKAVEETLRDDPNSVSWLEEFVGQSLFGNRRIVTAQGRLDGAESDVGTNTSTLIRDAAVEIGLTEENGYRVRLSGRGPLSQEEVTTAVQDIQLAGSVSLGLLAIVLFIGFRSLGRIAACLLCLLIGLAWTFGVATLLVGELTILSIVFAVLFIGLGIDFFIHASLRHAEEQEAESAARGSGSALTLCAVSTAIGFLSFLPTDFIGMAELGVIAAAGMVMAWVASFTVLPALLTLLSAGHKTTRPTIPLPAANGAADFVRRRHREISIAALVFGIGAALLATQARFDFNSIALKDPRSESIQTLLDLQSDGLLTPYSAAIVFDTLQDAEAARDQLEALPQVSAVRSPLNLVPSEQDIKLLSVQDAAILLWGALDPFSVAPPLSTEERVDAVQRLSAALESIGDAETASLLQNLNPEKHAELEDRIITPLQHLMDRLRDFLKAEAFTLDDLPSDLSGQFFAPDGAVQIQVLPQDDLRDSTALASFVDAVTAIHPEATGRPILEARTGEIAVTSFLQAVAIASIAITLLLSVILRNLREVIAVMAPLVVAALATAAFGVVANVPFNLANLIAVPLIFGLGVDNGIHFVARSREAGDPSSVFRSSTFRAILLSAATTMAAFSTLMLAGNPGIAGMGLLLTVAMCAILFSTLFVVPALLTQRSLNQSN